MSNIISKNREELGENSNIIVTSVDNAVEESTIPTIIDDIDPSISEIADAMKYVIDSGWFGKEFLYARKITTCNKYLGYIPGVIFTDDITDIDYYVSHEYCKIQEEYPLVIGKYKRDNETNTYDGDVFIVTNDAKQLSLKEWEEMNFQRSNKNQG